MDPLLRADLGLTWLHFHGDQTVVFGGDRDSLHAVLFVRPVGNVADGALGYFQPESAAGTIEVFASGLRSRLGSLVTNEADLRHFNSK